ncbi:polyketide synthase [Roseibium salinum]|nr:polyketide synthase [Roseibium salinum]
MRRSSRSLPSRPSVWTRSSACCWKPPGARWKNSGYGPDELPRDTGVFVGITSLDYAALWRAEGLEADGHVATGNSLAMAANRLSHLFNLNGPSQAIDTACSSSLIALLRARDALRMGQCSAAIVGGVNLCLSREGFEGPHRAGMLSPTGHCHTFGRSANGYARGEGVAALLLKRLAEAERDGDRILGVIAGGAENHGGHSGALTAPNAKVQARLIVDAMRGIDPQTVSYIEAHGTGTELGDPVEINGLKAAFAELGGLGACFAHRAGGPSNPTSGTWKPRRASRGVIKVLMAMQRNELPPTLHSEPLNPHIDLDGPPFSILRERQAWKPDAAGTPRRAGVSSFGFGGANAHVVLESYDRQGGHSRHPLPLRPFADTRFWIPAVGKPGAIETLEDQQALIFFARMAGGAGERSSIPGTADRSGLRRRNCPGPVRRHSSARPERQGYRGDLFKRRPPVAGASAQRAECARS